MATSSTSVSSNDRPQAAYSKGSLSGRESKPLRLDDATASAFDLLLELPLFRSEVVSSSTVVTTDGRADEPKAESAEEKPALKDKEDEETSNPLFYQLAVAPPKGLDDASSTHDPILVGPLRRLDQENDGKQVIAEPTLTQAKVASTQQTVVADQAIHIDDTPINALSAEKTIDSNERPLPKIDEFTALREVKPSDSTKLTVEPVPVAKATTAKSDSNHHRREDRKDPLPDSLEANATIETVKPESDEWRKRSDRQDLFSEDADRITQNNTRIGNRRSERLADIKREGRTDDGSENERAEDREASEGRMEISHDFDRNREEVELASLNLPAISPIDVLAPATESYTPSTVPGHQADTVSSAVSGSAVSTSTPSIAGTVTAGGESALTAPVSAVGGTSASSSVSSGASARGSYAASGRGSVLTPYQEQRILHRVLRGFDQLSDGSNQVRLRLHPPELGSLQVTLRVEAQQVAALIEVEHPAAKDTLVANLPQLQSRLAEQGLAVTQFDVQVVDPSQWSQGEGLGSTWGEQPGTGQQEEGSGRSSRYLDRLRNRLDRPSMNEPSRSLHSLWTRNNGQLDVRY